MNDLMEKPVRNKGSRRAKVRRGRPPKELEGEVDERILNAAREKFLERGFEGASIDEIAVAARAGKPTIYSRFGDKRGSAVRRPGRGRSKSASRRLPSLCCTGPWTMKR